MRRELNLVNAPGLSGPLTNNGVHTMGNRSPTPVVPIITLDEGWNRDGFRLFSYNNGVILNPTLSFGETVNAGVYQVTFIVDKFTSIGANDKVNLRIGKDPANDLVVTIADIGQKLIVQGTADGTNDFIRFIVADNTGVGTFAMSALYITRIS